MKTIALLIMTSILVLSCQNSKDSKLQNTLTEDDFIGIFELDPNRSSYEAGPEISEAIVKIDKMDYQYKITTDNIEVSGLPLKNETIVKEGKTIDKDSYTILKVNKGPRMFIDRYDTDGEFIEGSMRELIVENEKIILVETSKSRLPQNNGFYINKQTYIKR